MRAWTFQDQRQKKKLGEKKCPWSVGWIDPDGTRRSERIGSKSMAGKFARKLEGQLAAGTYRAENRRLWSEFWAEYEGRRGPPRVNRSVEKLHVPDVLKIKAG
jgi:hypothetical protein